MATSKKQIQDTAMYCNCHFLYYAKGELDGKNRPMIVWFDADNGNEMSREFTTNTELHAAMVDEYTDLDKHIAENAR